MKTIKLLKISVVFQMFFVFSCIFPIVCFAINRYFGIHALVGIGEILSLCLVFNPTGLLTLVIGMSLYLYEKENQDFKKIIGRKWIWFILFFVMDTLLYLASGGMIVLLTGGV